MNQGRRSWLQGLIGFLGLARLLPRSWRYESCIRAINGCSPAGLTGTVEFVSDDANLILTRVGNLITLSTQEPLEHE